MLYKTALNSTILSVDLYIRSLEDQAIPLSYVLRLQWQSCPQFLQTQELLLIFAAAALIPSILYVELWNPNLQLRIA